MASNPVSGYTTPMGILRFPTQVSMHPPGEYTRLIWQADWSLHHSQFGFDQPTDERTDAGYLDADEIGRALMDAQVSEALNTDDGPLAREATRFMLDFHVFEEDHYTDDRAPAREAARFMLDFHVSDEHYTDYEAASDLDDEVFEDLHNEVARNDFYIHPNVQFCFR